MATKKTDIMKKKDEPKKKNLIWIARENAGLTRKEVEARCPWMTESRLQKIESGTQRMTPDDVHALSAIYGDKELCRTYCQRVCKIGTVCNPADDECKPVTQIVLEMLSALNAANRRKDQLVDIAADGSISDDEFDELVAIKNELMRISDVVDELQKWTKSKIDKELIPQIRDGK